MNSVTPSQAKPARKLRLWSIFNRTTGMLEGANTLKEAREIYSPDNYVALRRNYRGQVQLAFLCTGLIATRREEREIANGLHAASVRCGIGSPFSKF